MLDSSLVMWGGEFGRTPVAELPALNGRDHNHYGFSMWLAGGATARRDLPIPGREATGVYQAMEYLPGSNRVQEGDRVDAPISAAGKRVVIIGGGDTGADCLGTAHRQGAASVEQFEIMEQPPTHRTDAHPWPTWPFTYSTTSAHEEGGERTYAVSTKHFVADEDNVLTGLHFVEVRPRLVDGRMSFDEVPGSETELPVDLVFLAMGFTGPEDSPLLEQFGVERDARSNVARDDHYRTSADDVWVCGDMGRGQSLIVWAIAEGRSCAASVDAALMGSTDLPTPVAPGDRPL